MYLPCNFFSASNNELCGWRSPDYVAGCGFGGAVQGEETSAEEEREMPLEQEKFPGGPHRHEAPKKGADQEGIHNGDA